MNWKEEIVKLVVIKQVMAELDTQGLWSYHLPAVAATPEEISDAEEFLGHSLDARYIEFLKHANGWLSFYQTVDLFGTADLRGGPKMEHAQSILAVLDEAVIRETGFNHHELLPIASTLLDRDLFLISKPTSKTPGVVIWFSGEEVDRFENFEEFFLSMMDYNRAEVDYFKGASVTSDQV